MFDGTLKAAMLAFVLVGLRLSMAGVLFIGPEIACVASRLRKTYRAFYIYIVWTIDTSIYGNVVRFW